MMRAPGVPKEKASIAPQVPSNAKIVSTAYVRAVKLTRVMAVLAVVALTVAAATTPAFGSVENIRALAIAGSVTGVLAAGMTPITVSGNYVSLSLGATLIVCNMVFLSSLGSGLVLALAYALAFGLAIGVIQGVVVGWLGLNPFISTIAVAALLQGAAVGITNGQSVAPASDDVDYTLFTSGNIVGIPKQALIFLIVAIIVGIVLRQTKVGKELYLMGSGLKAAKVSGLNITFLTAFAFGLAGLCAALAGIMQSSQGLATFGFNSTYDFDAITAVLVGGTAIAGGKGGVGRTVLGVLFLTVFTDILLLRGTSVETQLLYKGIIILIIVGMSSLMARLKNPRTA